MNTGQNRAGCTGTCLTCTGTCWPKMTITQTVPVHVQGVPVHVIENCPECVFSPIFHALSSIDHSYYILHKKLTWNPSKQLPPILLIRQRIQRFTQFYQNFGIVKDSIFNYDQLGIFNQTSFNSRVRMCS